MIRRTTVVTVGVIAWLALVAMPAGAQTPLADNGASTADVVPVPVAVDLTGVLDPPVDTGVLVRSEAVSSAPMMAVYFGLSLLGLTLGVITARRRLLALKATELATGVVVGRRARTEFWGSGAGPERVAAGIVGGRPRFRPTARSGVSMLLGSGDTVTIAEHGPPVRAGYAGGATDG